MSTTAQFFYDALAHAGVNPHGRLLDFGCGRGALVNELRKLGTDAYGCDVDPYWSDVDPERFKPISRKPYRIPFDDSSFDAVISTSVLEHAQNTRELLEEIKRVLRPGGLSMHIYPSKWYLPAEPHIYVPLVNYFWPLNIGLWLDLWAMAGIRNEYQGGNGWREVSAANLKYYRTGICYRSHGFYKKLSLEIFGNCEWPMRYFIDHSDGGMAAIARRLPFKSLSAWVMKQTRMAFIVQRKD